MDNFIIRHNAEANTTEIDIFGDIGESWWGESVEFTDIKNQLESITSDNIKLNISTYGGDVNHAFAIYNLLKTHPAKIEANIMGFTASAGTIVALAADTVSMDENTMFLVHNAWTMSIGNQHDLRKTADELEKIDNRLISIYKTKTGKRKDTIHNLMKEEKWLDSSEAKEWGFVDDVYAPMKAAASIKKDIDNINKTDYLPKINKSNNDMGTIKEELTAKINAIADKVNEWVGEKKSEVSKDEVSAKVEELIKAEVETLEKEEVEALAKKAKEFEAKEKELTEKFDKEKAVFKTEVDALTKQVNELKGIETNFNTGTGGENPTGDEEKTEGEKILLNILGKSSEIEKLQPATK